VSPLFLILFYLFFFGLFSLSVFFIRPSPVWLPPPLRYAPLNVLLVELRPVFLSHLLLWINLGLSATLKINETVSGKLFAKTFDFFFRSMPSPEKDTLPQILASSRWICECRDHCAFLRTFFPMFLCGFVGRSSIILSPEISAPSREMLAAP